MDPGSTPYVIAVGGLKGGLGKTTLAIFLAMVYATKRGKRVLFVDADPKSQTGWDWWTAAQKTDTPLPFDIEVWPHARVGQMVADRASDYDVVIIDTGGDSDAILAAAVEVAHYILLVTTPNKPDMRRLAATFQAAQVAAQSVGRDEFVEAAVVITKLDNRRAAYNAETRAQIEERLPILVATLSLRASLYADSFGRCPTGPEDLAEAEAIVKEMEAA